VPCQQFGNGQGAVDMPVGVTLNAVKNPGHCLVSASLPRVCRMYLVHGRLRRPALHRNRPVPESIAVPEYGRNAVNTCRTCRVNEKMRKCRNFLAFYSFSLHTDRRWATGDLTAT
jgi:hypothetical protein